MLDSNKFKIDKTTSGKCPNCGYTNIHIIQGKYPEYDEFSDTLTKWFICDNCLTEYYEILDLQYAGCQVVVFNEETSENELAEYDKTGYKKIYTE